MRIRLKPYEAIAIGLDVKSGYAVGNARYEVTEEQIESVHRLRKYGNTEFKEVKRTLNKDGEIITKVEKLSPKNLIDIPLDHVIKRVSTNVATNQQWIITEPIKGVQQSDFEVLKNELIESLQSHSPNYPKIERTRIEDDHLFILDIADLHINKYATTELTGAEYNSQIAVQRAIEGTKGLLQKASGFNIDQIVFVIGNDVLNTDNLTKSTTKNTPQDTDVSWIQAFRIAYNCYVACIELCLSVADVHVVHCVSNHDFMSGAFLAETVQAHFRLSENMTWDIGIAYRKYYQYHNNLIELEHGDKGKVANLPLLVAESQPQMWADTKFRYGYFHHQHHSDVTKYQSGKDYIGFNVTFLRSPSSADIWHADSSYLNMVAVEGFVHSKQNGRVSHITNYF